LSSDNLFLHENYSDTITAKPELPRQLSLRPGTVTTFAFRWQPVPDLEQGRLRSGPHPLRQLDHQRRPALGSLPIYCSTKTPSARASPSRIYFPKASLMVPTSPTTASFRPRRSKNILLSQLQPGCNPSKPNVLAPAGATLPRQLFRSRRQQEAFSANFRFDANVFRRAANNYADDDQIFNTSISFPVAFEKAHSLWRRRQDRTPPPGGASPGFISESYIVRPTPWYPVTGGLFLGVSKKPVSINLWEARVLRSPAIFPRFRRTSATAFRGTPFATR